MPRFTGKEEIMPEQTVVQIVAGVLALCVLGIIVYRRKQKSA